MLIQRVRTQTLVVLTAFLALAAGCEAPPPVRPNVVRSAVSATSRDHGFQVDRPDLRLADGQAVVRGSWGAGPGEFGRVLEASRPGPMSLTVDSEGGIHVLDQVNRRIQRFDRRGRLLGTVATIAETSEDLLLTAGTYRVLAYQPGAPPRYRIDALEVASGRALPSVSLPPELTLATRLLASGDPARPELSIELARRESVAVARGEQPLARPRLLGRSGARPAERLLVRREHEGRAAIVERVLPGRYTARVARLAFDRPILAIETWELAASGTLALSLALDGPGGDGRQGRPEESDVPRRIAALLPAGGGPPIAIELAGRRACDVFRAIALGPDGALHVLETSEAGVTVRRYPAPGGGR